MIETSTESSTDSAVLAQQTKSLYGALKLALLATFINSAILVFVLWPVVPAPSMLIWLAVLWSLSAARWFSARQYQRLPQAEQNDTKWYRYFTIGACAAGLVWGSAAIWLYPSFGIAYQIFFTFVLGGMAAGALTSLAFERRVSIAFLCFLMGPLLVRVFISQEQLNVVMGLMLVYFFLMFVLAAVRISANTRQNIRYEMDLEVKARQIKQSEQYNQVLLQSASDAFFLHDLQGRFVDVNKQACESLGYTREELLNMTVADVEKGADNAMLKAVWPQLKQAGKIEVECFHQTKDGHRFPVEVHLGPVEIGEGRYISALARDITVHKEALHASNQAMEEAERLSSAKTRFLSHMSHELRTPLNAVLGFAQILQMDNRNFSESQNVQVAEIYKAGNFLLEMITEILDLSRIESGKMELNCVAVKLNDVLAEALNLVASLADKYEVSIKLQNDLPDGYIWADPKRVKQVLLNLMSNGVKYNSHPGELLVDCQRLDDNMLRIKVSDSGDGLSEDELSKLFRPFERLDDKPNIEGTGVGLVITKYLIEGMGGQIGVNSTKGKGSEFWLDFVLCAQDAVESPR